MSRTCSAGVGTLTLTDAYQETSATDGPHAVALGTAPSNYIKYASVPGGSSDSTHYDNVPAGRPTVEWITPSGAIRSKIVAVCPSTLTMAAPTDINYGQTATFTAVLTDATSHAPIAGATVHLVRHSQSGTAWFYVLSATTNSSGVAKLVIAPRSFTVYAWRFSGSSTNASTSSPGAIIDVHQVVSIHAPSAVAPGHLATIWGTVAPAVSGNEVHLQRFTATGWVSAGVGFTQRQLLPNGATAIGYVFHAPAGQYRVVALATFNYGRGNSKTVTIGIT